MYDLSSYGTMACDRSRDLYDRVLEKRIEPGKTRVLDIGAGTGFLSLLALKHGAAKVYACETDPEALNLLPSLLEENQVDPSRISLHCSSSRGLTLHDLDGEKVDMIISDIHGVLPHNSVLRSIYDARRLLKEEGCMIPGRDVIQIAPLDDYAEWKRLERPWGEEGIRGIVQTSLREKCLSRFYKHCASKDSLLSEPGTIKDVSYQSPVSDDKIVNSLTFSIARLGTLHGFAVWFNAEIDEGFWIYNEPGKMNSHLYQHLFLPLTEPVPVRPGWNISLNINIDISDDFPGEKGLTAKCIKSGTVSDEEASPVAFFSNEAT